MEKLSLNELDDVVGGVANYMNMKTSKLKSNFTSACRTKNMNKIMELLPELQARGEYGWARETAHTYGITSI